MTIHIQHVLEQIDAGLVIHDHHGNIVWANQAAARLLDFDLDELIGLKPNDTNWVLTKPNGARMALDEFPIIRVLENRRPIRGELLCIQSIDGPRWLEIDAFPVFNDDDALMSVAVAFHEHQADSPELNSLREQKLALEAAVSDRDNVVSETQRALALTESNYRATVRAMAEGVAVHALSGEIIDANPAAQTILGQSLEQLRGILPVDPAWKLTHPDGRELQPDEIPSEMTARTGEPCRNVLLEVTRGDGSRATLSVNTDPIMINGEIHGVVATFSDVTKERQLLTMIEENRDRLQRLTEHLPAVVFEGVIAEDDHPDRPMHFKFVGAGAESILGVSSEALASGHTSIRAQLTEESRAIIRLARDRIIRERTTSDLEVQTLPIDGVVRDLRIQTSAPVETPEGLSVFGFVQDITEQKAMSRAVRDAQRRESVGTLAAGIAHNFNNVLATILPNLELAREHLPAELARDMDGAIHAATNASDLVKQLLLLSRPAEKTETAAININPLIRETARICERTFDRQISLHSTIPSRSTLVQCIAGELEQVVLNLCINARDAVAGRENPRIDIVLEASAGTAMITVTDNGVGMTDEVQARLGNPFFTTKERGVGNGLGLASAIGIVEDFGGTLTWFSRPGEGARFTVKLPLVEPLKRENTEATEDRPSLDGRRILIIDDDDMIRLTLSRMLKRLGLNVISAGDGQSGLETLAARHDIDLVCLDYSMPGMSGEDVLIRLREQDPGLPVILMSGQMPDTETTRLASVVLQKPARMAQIEEAVHAAFAPETRR